MQQVKMIVKYSLSIEPLFLSSYFKNSTILNQNKFAKKKHSDTFLSVQKVFTIFDFLIFAF